MTYIASAPGVIIQTTVIIMILRNKNSLSNHLNLKCGDIHFHWEKKTNSQFIFINLVKGIVWLYPGIVQKTIILSTSRMKFITELKKTNAPGRSRVLLAISWVWSRLCPVSSSLFVIFLMVLLFFLFCFATRKCNALRWLWNKQRL